MKSVNVKRQALLNSLKANLESHRRNYSEACRGYRAMAARALDERAARLRKGETVNVDFGRLTPPENHEADYADVIGMLEMSVDEHVELSHPDYKSFVKDEWGWKHGWEVSNSMYFAGQ